MQVEDFIKRRNELKELIRKEGKNMLQDMFLEVFNETPGLEAIQWTQYTPSFNDGDPCVFSVGDPSYKIHDPTVKESEEEDADDEQDDDFQDSYSIKNSVLQKKLKNFEKKFEDIGDVFEDVFGDNTKITAKITNGKIKFKTEQYYD